MILKLKSYMTKKLNNNNNNNNNNNDNNNKNNINNKLYLSIKIFHTNCNLHVKSIKKELLKPIYNLFRKKRLFSSTISVIIFFLKKYSIKKRDYFQAQCFGKKKKTKVIK